MIELGKSILLKLCNYVVFLLLVAGLVMFYTLHIGNVYKWLILLACIIASGLVFFFLSPTGVNLHIFFKSSWQELKKVVWPSRKETVQFTWIVFIFIAVLALFLWLVDSVMSWLLYDVLLKVIS